MLADISTYIDKDELTGINPDIIDSIKEIGDGRLYALSDTISSQALFFNKDLFKQYGIPEPTNNMSWGDIINLADRFSTEANITGIYLPYYDAADFLVTMGKTRGYNMVR